MMLAYILSFSCDEEPGDALAVDARGNKEYYLLHSRQARWPLSIIHGQSWLPLGVCCTASIVAADSFGSIGASGRGEAATGTRRIDGKEQTGTGRV